MGNKKTVGITIDKDIWELAGLILPCSRSKFIENTLKEYINSSNDIEKLKNELKEKETEISILKQKIEQIEDIEAKNSKDINIINKAMTTVYNIVNAHGKISKEQINYIARNNTIKETVLIDKIEKENIKIVLYTE